MRHLGDSNPCGQSPMDFESISLAARTKCLAARGHGDASVMQTVLVGTRACPGRQAQPNNSRTRACKPQSPARYAPGVQPARQAQRKCAKSSHESGVVRALLVWRSGSGGGGGGAQRATIESIPELHLSCGSVIMEFVRNGI